MEREGNGVTWLYMNRPEKMNAMNPKIHREMWDTLSALELDDETRVVVLTGAGSGRPAL